MKNTEVVEKCWVDLLIDLNSQVRAGKRSDILQNAVEYNGVIYQSTSRHDFVSLPNGQYIDGGRDYIRRSFDLRENSDYVDLNYYVYFFTEPECRIDYAKNILVWGSRGLKGLDAVKYTRISDMTTDHLIAVLKYYGLLLSDVTHETFQTDMGVLLNDLAKTKNPLFIAMAYELACRLEPESTEKDFSVLETFNEQLLTNNDTKQDNETMTVEQLNTELVGSGLRLDLKTLISECMIPKSDRVRYFNYKNILFSKEVTTTPITVTVKEIEDDVKALVVKAYQNVLHTASLKCHRNDPNVIPMELEQLRTETIEQYLIRTKQPMDVKVPLKGDN